MLADSVRSDKEFHENVRPLPYSNDEFTYKDWRLNPHAKALLQ